MRRRKQQTARPPTAPVDDPMPEPAPPAKWFGFEVTKRFKCQGVIFEPGQRLSTRDPLAREMYAEAPSLFKIVSLDV
jgi:hypothetical protein